MRFNQLKLAVITTLFACLAIVPIPSYAQSAGVVQAVTRADIASHKHPTFKVEGIVYKAEYAITAWSDGEAGGEDVFHYQGGSWHYLEGGGGAIDVSAMTSHYHMPLAVAKNLKSQMNAFMKAKYGGR